MPTCSWKTGTYSIVRRNLLFNYTNVTSPTTGVINSQGYIKIRLMKLPIISCS